MNSALVVGSLEAIEVRLAPWRERLAGHALYANVRTVEDVRVLMESHVFAVWDFMSLLKALQRRLTCVELPWVPTRFAASRRFINEIVLGEESDLYEGRAVSHFEVYLQAMEQAGAETAVIRRVVEGAGAGFAGVDFAGVPAGAREFVETTFRLVREGSAAAQAAAFAFGREDAIPEMFRLLVRGLNGETGGALGKFVWYLERHIEVDGEDHGPLSRRMVEDLCGEDAARWEEAGAAAEEALRARVRLWDGVLELLQQR